VISPAPQIRFLSDGLFRHAAAGVSSPLLSVTLEVGNLSSLELTLDPDDLRLVTASGTLVSSPEMLQDGVGVNRARLPGCTESAVQLFFALPEWESPESFDFFWGARLGQGTHSGRVEFQETPDGFQPVTVTPLDRPRALPCGGGPGTVRTTWSSHCRCQPVVQPDCYRFNVFSGWPFGGFPPGPWYPGLLDWGVGVSTGFVWHDTGTHRPLRSGVRLPGGDSCDCPGEARESWRQTTPPSQVRRSHGVANPYLYHRRPAGTVPERVRPGGSGPCR
jgi:hypothetical protein